MTVQEAQERVARGAALLDAKRPGWAEKIDIGNLDMPRCDRCILGQVFGDYVKAINDDADLFGSWRCFALDPNVEYAEIRDAAWSEGYRVLTDAWLSAIADRLVPAVEWTHRERALVAQS